MELARRRVPSPEYWAGLFDGEGCVRIAADNGRAHRVMVDITNAHLGILQRLQDRYGGSLRLLPVRALGRQELWRWQASAAGFREFLLDIQDFSVIKRAQIDIALDFSEKRRKAHRYRPLTSDEIAQGDTVHQQLKELKIGVS